MNECRFSFPHPLSDDFVRNPYPHLSTARMEAPVHFLEALNLWIVTRHEHIKGVLKDAATFSNANAQTPLCAITDEAREVLRIGGFEPGPSLTAVDPPLHTRFRHHYSKVVSFTPSKAARIRPWIERRCSRLIDGFAARRNADLVAELAVPLPADVIFHLIGFPERDYELLLGWCAARLQMFFGETTPQVQLENAQRMVEYWNYCVQFIENSAADPQDNYAGDLLRIHLDDPQALSLSEIKGFIYALIFAGQETTANATASMLRLLLEDRRHWEMLQAHPELIETAVEESLRLEPSIAAWRRVATRDTEIDGVKIPKGAQLLLHLGSAGHDESVFEAGEIFDLGRKNINRHLTFGHGIHFCLGAGLARTEMQIILQQLLERLPGLRLSDGAKFEYVPNIAFRGPSHLPVEW